MQSPNCPSIHSSNFPSVYSTIHPRPFIHPSIHVCLSIQLLNYSSFPPPTIQTHQIIWQPIQPLTYLPNHPSIHLSTTDPPVHLGPWSQTWRLCFFIENASKKKKKKKKMLPAHIHWPVIVPTSLAYTLGHISQHFPIFLGGYLDMDSFISCDIHSFLSPSNMPGTWLVFYHLIFTKAPWGKY